eukprot:CAMPEP_0119064020 /NCGR_PEP_ID=MMETSP1178-20130426/7211_1 /TAXON_ID=33656 /ORGANISM="unid sp, Strain CCMP2000" /LENGTH=216 /DNA_ID=CAMNT_0007045421 /DNA_START=48 /DNA_END=698 /DNA_ORIENTATION=+
MARPAAALLLLAPVTADIVLSRTVKSFSAGSGKITLEGGACTASDAYGSNACDLDWGKTYTAAIDGTLGKDIESGDTFTADITVDRVANLKFTCQLCGANCTFTIPVLRTKYTFPLPACPIKAGAVQKTKTFTLPASSPVPLKVGFTGTVTAQDEAGNSLASVHVKGEVSKSSFIVSRKTPAVVPSIVPNVVHTQPFGRANANKSGASLVVVETEA